MGLHSPFAILFDDPGMTGPVSVAGVGSQSHQLNPTVTAAEDGAPWDDIVFMEGEDPTQPFTTTALKSILELMPSGQMCFDFDGTHEGFVSYSEKHDRCGMDGRAAAGAHQSVQFKYGHIFIDSISVQGRGPVIVNMTAHALLKTGETKPYVVSYAATLPASPARQIFGKGKPEILGTVVERVQSINIAFNRNIQKSDDGESIWVGDLDGGKTAVETTIVTEDPEWFETAGRVPGGGVSAGTNTKLWFLQAELTGTPASGGKFKNFIASDHIEALLRGWVYVNAHDEKSGGGTGTTTITIRGKRESGVNPVVFNVDTNYQ